MSNYNYSFIIAACGETAVCHRFLFFLGGTGEELWPQGLAARERRWPVPWLGRAPVPSRVGASRPQASPADCDEDDAATLEVEPLWPGPRWARALQAR